MLAHELLSGVLYELFYAFPIINVFSRARGPIYYDLFEQFGEDGKKALIRLKARELIVTLDMGKGYYKYDLTPLGKDVLDAWKSTMQPQDSQHSNRIVH